MSSSLHNEFESLSIREDVVESLRNKTVVITGATGLVGAYFLQYLLFLNRQEKLGLKIIILCRSETKARALFGDHIENGTVEVIVHNVNDTLVEPIVADYFIHAASPADPLSFSTMPVETMLSNIIGTVNMLDMLKNNGFGRMLYVSTGEVYGELEHNISKREDMSGYVDSMNPRSCYPSSKRAAETLCSSYKCEFGVDSVVARLCYVFGPTITSSNSRADAQFLRKAAAGEAIILKSEGLQRRSYCYVGDAVTALLTILVLGASGEAYNVANSKSNATIREYAETLADIARVPIKFQLPDSIEARGYSKISHAVLSADKLLALGWIPNFDLRAGLELTYRSYKKYVEV